MSDKRAPGDTPRTEVNGNRRHPLVIALSVLLWLECAFLAGLTVFLVVELVVARPDSYASAVAILVLTGLAAVWLGTLAFNAVRRRPWVRAGAVVWQVLQIGIAIASFQGLFSRPDVGWLLLIPAVVVLVLIFTPPVVAATTRPER
ncbi:MAG: hypothetical protein QOE21_1237 [Microbacteriaceae bacterium]|nr:hypothetical protein [Microbacteriaceae bacterium]